MPITAAPRRLGTAHAGRNAGLAAPRALFKRRDVIIVASGSCIYGLGDPNAHYSVRITAEMRASSCVQPARLRQGRRRGRAGR
jgi:hypothetical protein